VQGIQAADREADNREEEITHPRDAAVRPPAYRKVKEMFINSGKCRLCKTGLPTELIDDVGKELKTGDIVILYTMSKDTGIVEFASITAVVANHYDNIQGLDPIECIEENKGKAFIMGIASVDIRDTEENYPVTVWRVKKLKSHTDVVDGEHWPEFGFNYST